MHHTCAIFPYKNISTLNDPILSHRPTSNLNGAGIERARMQYAEGQGSSLLLHSSLLALSPCQQGCHGLAKDGPTKGAQKLRRTRGCWEALTIFALNEQSWLSMLHDWGLWNVFAKYVSLVEDNRTVLLPYTARDRDRSHCCPILAQALLKTP